MSCRVLAVSRRLWLIALVSVLFSGCGGAGDAPSLTGVASGAATEATPGEWILDLRSRSGRPYLGSNRVTVRFKRDAFECAGTAPRAVSEGDRMEVFTEDDFFIATEPPQVVAMRVRCLP